MLNQINYLCFPHFYILSSSKSFPPLSPLPPPSITTFRPCSRLPTPITTFHPRYRLLPPPLLASATIITTDVPYCLPGLIRVRKDIASLFLCPAKRDTTTTQSFLLVFLAPSEHVGCWLLVTVSPKTRYSLGSRLRVLESRFVVGSPLLSRPTPGTAGGRVLRSSDSRFLAPLARHRCDCAARRIHQELSS